MDSNSRVYIAGHRGLVGSALIRRFKQAGFRSLITRTQAELNLMRQDKVEMFFASEQPEYVILAAAKVGGIYANNTFPGEFIYNNLMIQSNVIEQARQHKVKRFLFLGSNCIYPRQCPQPIKEDSLLTCALEPTNEPYAIAKIAGLKMCQAYNKQYHTNYLTLMPVNLYGPGDNFYSKNSHVLPALIHRFHCAKQEGLDTVTVWGTGKPLREFMHADDLADACFYFLQQEWNESIINIGSGEEISIASLVKLVQSIVGYTGNIIFDTSMPDGTPRKKLDLSKQNALGWQPKTSLKKGIQETYGWYCQRLAEASVP